MPLIYWAAKGGVLNILKEIISRYIANRKGLFPSNVMLDRIIDEENTLRETICVVLF